MQQISISQLYGSLFLTTQKDIVSEHWGGERSQKLMRAIVFVAKRKTERKYGVKPDLLGEGGGV